MSNRELTRLIRSGRHRNASPTLDDTRNQDIDDFGSFGVAESKGGGRANTDTNKYKYRRRFKSKSKTTR